MKNKKGIYILLPVVLLLWAFVAYQVMQYINKEKVPGTTSYFPSERTSHNNRQTSEYELLLNYPDPFLKQQRKAAPRKPERTNVRQARDQFDTRQNQRTRNVRWPSISYHGMIINEKNRTTIAFLLIDDQQYILGKDEQAGQVLVKSVYEDSVVVEYEQEQKTIIKAQ